MVAEGRLALAAGLALLVFAAPLPFGGVLPAAEAGLLVGAFLLFALALAKPVEEDSWRKARGPAFALALVAGWGLLQAVPLPRALHALAPARLELAARAGEPPATLPLSFSPWLSVWSALAVLAAAALLVASAALGRERSLRRAVWGAIGLVSVGEVLVGARAWLERSPTIWGVPVATDLTRLRGTFVNPNHLATWLLIPLAGAFAWLWWALRRSRDAGRLEERILLVSVPALVWLVLFAGLAATGSRGGLVAWALGTTLQAALLMLRRGLSWRYGLAAGGALAGAGALAFSTLGGEGVLGRWLGASGAAGGVDRLTVWTASLELVARFPFLGTGLGSFRDVFPLVQPAATPGLWWHAHNDWLEALVTLGLVGFALLLSAVALASYRLSETWKHGRRSEDRATALAALGALAAVAVHEVFDFGLTMPANALALAAVVGLGLGVPRGRGTGEATSRTGG
ncbi:MAG TPA: O-antigen ligase family protein [Thermoanaerobaculia bacterium]|nr:O-antigen ligase family protein [Thermoanaerobaculia bacterium]